MTPSYISQGDEEIADSDSGGRYTGQISEETVVDEDVEARPEKRAFHAIKSGIEKYSQHSDKECFGCMARRSGYQIPFAHSNKCSQRIMGHVLADGDFDKRVEKAMWENA